jgi:hypothetical protein
MKERLTVSVSQDVASEMRAEAERDGLSVSEWVERAAHREATRASYARARAERERAGLFSEDHLAAYARRRAAVRHQMRHPGDDE